MTDFGIPYVETNLVGCVSRDGYSYNQDRSMDRLPALRGRPRFRLKDSFANYSVFVTMDMSATQFSAFQSLWNGRLERGNKSFVMKLMMTSLEIYESADEVYVVRAMEPWNAKSFADGRFRVSMVVQVPSDIAYVIVGCNTVWGGPITDPAIDVIWAGDIANLPDDVIVPCPGVLNS